MNQEEIRRKIDENNKIIVSCMTPNIFTLNNTISDLLEENRRLQRECQHVFENGVCKYCDLLDPISDEWE